MTLIERKSNGFICTSVRLEWSYNPELCYFGYLQLLLYRHYERRKILLWMLKFPADFSFIQSVQFMQESQVDPAMTSIQKLNEN